MLLFKDIENEIYLGHDQLDVLVTLKSKEELIGDVITLLQSPIKNLLSSLGSAKQNISGILNSLENNPVELKKTNEAEVNTSNLDKKDDSVDANTSTSEEWINKYNKNYKQIKNK